jgi:hypothetical protein
LGVGAALVAFTLAACSGGGGDSSNGATLEVSLMDAPVDGVTEVHVQIEALWLKPQGGNAIELPLNGQTMTVDLLELTEDNAAILIDDADVAAGSYEWLAMDVNAQFDGIYDSYVMTNVGGQEEIRVPSSRVRLVSGFDVAANQAVRLLFDWDLRKGLVDPPGQPGYLLKPAFRVIDVTEFGRLSGTVAPATISDPECAVDDANVDVGNVVYIYEGASIVPDDIDEIDPEPVATAAVAQNQAGDYVYSTILLPSAYTVAFTCQAGNDDPEVDDTLEFTAPVNAGITADANLVVDF